MLKFDYLGRVSVVIILECDCQMVRDAGLEAEERGGEGKGSSIIRPFK